MPCANGVMATVMARVDFYNQTDALALHGELPAPKKAGKPGGGYQIKKKTKRRQNATLT